MSIEYGRLLQYGLLSLPVAERLLPEKQLEEDDADRPNVNLVTNLRLVLLEALWRLVPVSANAL